MAPYQGRSPPPPVAGKSLSLSITLLRINFVEIKIGLGINLASRIFSGLWRPQRGQTPTPRLGLRLSFQGRHRPPNPPPTVTVSPLGPGHLIWAGEGTTQAPAFSSPGHEAGQYDSMDLRHLSFPCRDSVFSSATAHDRQDKRDTLRALP